MAQLSQATKKLIGHYKAGEESLNLTGDTPTIHVDEVAAKVAAFYEKIRGIIDWREEHLLKRNAIERILKRRVLMGIDLAKDESTRESIAEPLVFELIRGGHYPNDKIAETKITEVQKIIDKYIFILKNTPQAENGQEALNFYNWLLGIASCEVEESLSSSYKERALIEYMFESMKECIMLNEGVLALKPMKEEEKNVQIFIAVNRALFKLDAPVIGYHLLKYKYPDWRTIGHKDLSMISKDMLTTRTRIERNINHPLADKFYQICEKYDTPYLLLGDVMSSEPLGVEEKFSKPEVLEESIREAYAARVKTLKKRIGRAAIYATISIFITKIVFAMGIEIPVDKYLNSFNYLSLGINILTPPILMFFLVNTIRVPGQENLERVIFEAMKIIHETEKKDCYEIKTAVSKKRNLGIKAIIDLVYLLTFILSIGFIVWLLTALTFSVLSIIIFIVFISLIAFTGTKIRQRSKELQIIDEKESFFNLLVDLFAMPLIEVGKWLTSKWQRYNIISALFNILIDMPFMIFVEFIEQWRYFLKEKKDQIH
ncbi:MAG: hypothetical protein WC845_02255 [Candidatus Staskawiczbacteria bacterium]|jgi:hypothetical protein